MLITATESMICDALLLLFVTFRSFRRELIWLLNSTTSLFILLASLFRSFHGISPNSLVWFELLSEFVSVLPLILDLCRMSHPDFDLCAPRSKNKIKLKALYIFYEIDSRCAYTIIMRNNFRACIVEAKQAQIYLP